MKDYGQLFSLIHRYGRILMAGDRMENKVPGRVIPYMRLICETPGISQDYIAKTLKMDKGTVARTLKVMEKEELVERKPGRTDRRCYELYPTEKMLGIRDDCTRQVAKLQDIILDGITPEDLEVFDRVLTRMSENVVASVSDERVKEFEKEMEKKMMKDIGKRLEEKGGRQ